MKYLVILLIVFLVSPRIYAQSDWHFWMDQWYYEQQQAKEKEAYDKWQWVPPQLPSLPPPESPSLPLYEPTIEVHIDAVPQEDYLGESQS
ncbi:MAG TPA: hypothetical protein VFD13_08905 [Candidatus Kapabacteria bacterium]|nr:hypothetical protein [Candidatus Kapabacteria bacterium]